MARFLVLLAIVWLVWIAWRGWQRKRMSSATKKPPRATPSATRLVVPCAYCRLHVPTEEALHHGQYAFCCQDHRQRFQENQGKRDQ